MGNVPDLVLTDGLRATLVDHGCTDEQIKTICGLMPGQWQKAGRVISGRGINAIYALRVTRDAKTGQLDVYKNEAPTRDHANWTARYLGEAQEKLRQAHRELRLGVADGAQWAWLEESLARLQQTHDDLVTTAGIHTPPPVPVTPSRNAPVGLEEAYHQGVTDALARVAKELDAGKAGWEVRRMLHMIDVLSHMPERLNVTPTRNVPLDLAHTHKCAGCGQRFTGVRSDATYCSNACRQKAYRERSGS